MIRVAVIDDEPLARSGVVARLGRHHDFQVVGEYADGVAGLEGIRNASPDLLLLDIQMPALDGFAMLGELPVERRPMVIFLTAYDNFAVRAFDLRAIDYVLKPIDDERFDEALNRARELHAGRVRDSASMDHATSSRSCFSVRMGRRIAIIQASDLEWIEADGDYATLHTSHGAYLLRESLTSLSEQLSQEQFIRIHRSTIVRIDQIAEFQSLTNRDALLRLRDGTPLRVSRTHIENLQIRLNGMHSNR